MQMMVRTARLIQRKTQKDMADELGISQSAYARIETGRTNVSHHRARQIAKLLDMSLDDLFFGEESSFLREQQDEEVHSNAGVED